MRHIYGRKYNKINKRVVLALVLIITIFFAVVIIFKGTHFIRDNLSYFALFIKHLDISLYLFTKYLLMLGEKYFSRFLEIFLKYVIEFLCIILRSGKISYADEAMSSKQNLSKDRSFKDQPFTYTIFKNKYDYGLYNDVIDKIIGDNDANANQEIKAFLLFGWSYQLRVYLLKKSYLEEDDFYVFFELIDKIKRKMKKIEMQYSEDQEKYLHLNIFSLLTLIEVYRYMGKFNSMSNEEKELLPRILLRLKKHAFKEMDAYQSLLLSALVDFAVGMIFEIKNRHHELKLKLNKNTNLKIIFTFILILVTVIDILKDF